MRVAIAYTKSGCTLAASIKPFLLEMNCPVLDCGNPTPQTDYVDLAFCAGQTILEHHADRAILICAWGFSTCIAANKIKGLYAAPCYDLFEAQLSRSRYDTNVLCLSDVWTDPQDAHRIVRKWIETSFEKHPKDVRALNKIKTLEEQQLPFFLTGVKNNQSKVV